MGLEEDSINDLDVFLDTDELADLAWYDGSSFAVQFYNEYEASIVQDQEVETLKPYFETKADNVIPINIGDTVIIGNEVPDQVEYKVVSKQFDALGWSRVTLERA